MTFPAKAWSREELARVGTATEIEIAPVRRDGELRRATPIWVVRAGDELYVRSAYGPDHGWHGVARASQRARVTAAGIEIDVGVEDASPGVLDQVDAAYHGKYGRAYPDIVASITDAEHRRTTLRLLPAPAV